MIRAKGAHRMQIKNTMAGIFLVVSLAHCGGLSQAPKPNPAAPQPNTQPSTTQLTGTQPPSPEPTVQRPCSEPDRRGSVVAIVCPPDQTTEFIASMQRAFAARRLYAGEITGTWTPETLRSLRDFQSARGITTQSPSIAIAQELGLVPITRP